MQGPVIATTGGEMPGCSMAAHQVTGRSMAAHARMPGRAMAAHRATRRPMVAHRVTGRW